MTSAPTSFRRGTMTVAVGVGAFGLANYVFLAGATRLLGPAGFAEFNVFWGLVYGLGLGLFLPFEQEVSRRVALARGAGQDRRPTLRAAYRTAGAATAFLVIGTVPLAMVLAEPEDVARDVALCTVSYLALGLAYVSRGALSGEQQFGRYAAQFGVEGAVRIAVVGLVAAGLLAASVPIFALAVPMALVAGVLVSTRVVARGGPVLPLGEFSRKLAPIIVSSMVVSSLINLGPVTVNLLTDTSEKALAGSFLAAAILTRLPILAFSAVQAVLIPRLVRSVVAGDRQDFRKGLVTVLVPTLGLGALGMLTWIVAGAPLLHLLAGSEYDLPRADMTLLAAAVALYLVCVVLQAAALALSEHVATMCSWLAGGAAFGVLVLTLPLEPTRVVGWAMVGAFAVAACALAIVVGRAMARPVMARSAPDGASGQ
jgi:O-antigen/teichoic acid export membrane protein